MGSTDVRGGSNVRPRHQGYPPVGPPLLLLYVAMVDADRTLPNDAPDGTGIGGIPTAAVVTWNYHHSVNVIIIISITTTIIRTIVIIIIIILTIHQNEITPIIAKGGWPSIGTRFGHTTFTGHGTQESENHRAIL